MTRYPHVLRDTVLGFVVPIVALAGVVILLGALHWALRELGWWGW
jgi:hypothetical protein